MSLASKIATLDQKQQLAVWKKTSSPTDRRVIRKNITNYLCEHTKKGVDAKAAIANNHPGWSKKGVDYLSKEEGGRLHAYGFLREDVMSHTGQIPHKMKNDDLVEACLGVTEGTLVPPELLGRLNSSRVELIMSRLQVTVCTNRSG